MLIDEFPVNLGFYWYTPFNCDAVLLVKYGLVETQQGFSNY